MITIAYIPADAPLAARIMDDLRTAGYPVGGGAAPGRDDVLIVVLSQPELDQSLQGAVFAALDGGRYVIPVLAERGELPRLLDHLPAVDARGGYAFPALRERLEAALAPGARLPMRVRTPKVQQSNRRAGLVLLGLVLFIFIFGTIAIIVFDIESPAEEYQQVDTEVALTRDVMIAPTMAYLSTYLPRSTEQAQVFSGTLEAVPTVLRPFVGQTATAIYDALANIYATPAAPSSTPDG